MSNPGKSGAGYPGQMGVNGPTSEFNRISFLVKQMLALFRTATIVQIKKCTNAGGVTAVGFVDVQPMVNMLDGIGTGSEHGQIYNLPYARLQGGVNAVICDPQVGDIGVAIIADRDISTVKKTKKIANPGSRRRADLADGIYLFGILNVAPQQYVRFIQDTDGSPMGMELVDKYGNHILMDTDGIHINEVLFDRSRNVSNAANIDATDEITAQSGSSDSVGLSTHTHGGVQTGSGDTDEPNGGT